MLSSTEDELNRRMLIFDKCEKDGKDLETIQLTNKLRCFEHKTYNYLRPLF